MIISSRTPQFLLAACLLIASGLFPEAARAHPLGNFTVNHSSRLKIDDNGVRITYIIDMAEIPAFQELRTADTDGNGITSQAELNAYVARVASSYVDGLVLEEDGRLEHLTVNSSKITALPGAGGLQTLRLEYELAGPVHQAAAVAPHRLRYGTLIKKIGLDGANLPPRRDRMSLFLTVQSSVTQLVTICEAIQLIC